MIKRERWVCLHGVREGSDFHSCRECQEIAKKLGWTSEDKETYLFTKDVIRALKGNKKVKKILKEMGL
jgi:hypothetical protein